MPSQAPAVTTTTNAATATLVLARPRALVVLLRRAANRMRPIKHHSSRNALQWRQAVDYDADSSEQQQSRSSFDSMIVHYDRTDLLILRDPRYRHSCIQWRCTCGAHDMHHHQHQQQSITANA